MINEIELVNWKAHSHTKLSFAKGTNILVGMMGAGKSSVLDAISYALFGSFPALRDGRISKNNIISNRLKQEQEAKVRLSFTDGNDNYVISRAIMLKGASKARIEKNGAVLQEQPDRVTEEVERILKIDYDLFTRAIYSEQNRLDYFLELRAGERKAEIDRLLGLDKFALAASNTASLINKIKDNIDSQQKSIDAFDLKKMENDIENLKKELEALRKNGADIEEKVKYLHTELEKSYSSLKEMKARYDKKQELAKLENGLESKKSILEREVSKLAKTSDEKEIRKIFDAKNVELNNARVSVSKAIDAEKKVEGDYARSLAKAEQLSKALQDMEEIKKKIVKSSVQALSEQIAAATTALGNFQEEFARYKSEKNETQKWAEELEKHISVCPVCERELDESMRIRLLEGKKKILAGIDEKINAAGKELEKKKKEIDALNSEMNSLKIALEKTKDFDRTNSELSLIKVNIEALKKESENAKDHRKMLEEYANKIAEEVSKLKSILDDIERAKKYNDEIIEISTKIREIAAQKDAITVGDDDLDMAQREFAKLSAEEGKAKADLEANISYVGEKQRQINEKERDMLAVKKVYDEIKSGRNAIEELSRFKIALEETQLVLRTKLVDSINSVMQEIWPELYPYGDYSKIMLNATSEDYVLMLRVTKEGEQTWENVEGMASGGERSIACLAMRIAFALVLVPNLKWLILDEPTHNIDRQGLSKFVSVFNETLPKIVDQIFIITHDEALKQVSNAKIYSLERDKETDGFSVVQEL